MNVEFGFVVEASRGSGARVRVLDGRKGERTGEELIIGSGFHAATFDPWSVEPRFLPTGTGYMVRPKVGTVLVFVRDPNNPNKVVQWTEEYYWAVAEARMSQRLPYRLVRREGGKAVEVLWATSGGMQVGHDVLHASARWPRLPDASDELSKLLAASGDADGTRFEMPHAGRWIRANDLRAPYHLVPDTYKQ